MSAALCCLIAFRHVIRRKRRGDRGKRSREHPLEVGVQALLYLGAGKVHHAAVPPLKGPRTVALLCFGGTIRSAT